MPVIWLQTKEKSPFSPLIICINARPLLLFVWVWYVQTTNPLLEIVINCKFDNH